jgi:hypothetical protein
MERLAAIPNRNNNQHVYIGWNNGGVKMKLTGREILLIDGMIAVQQDHADRCDNLLNRKMAEYQKARDLERVRLLEKLKKMAREDVK